LIKEENLQEGMELEEHMQAIAASKIAIIVFSKSYTEFLPAVFFSLKKSLNATKLLAK